MKCRGLFAFGFFLLSSTALMPVYEAVAKNAGGGHDGRQVGLVKPLSSWKVGTVSSGNAEKPYCAMVGTFERGMVLAVAKNDRGMGSLAIDFKDPIFETNTRYPVWVDLEGGVSREFQGMASSDRSLVVQFGKDDGFYKSLMRTSRIDLSTPDVDVGFSLAKTQNGSRKLDSCALQLVESAAGDISEDQEISDNPVDQEALKLTAENEELQKARSEIAALKARLSTPAKYDDIDAEISRRMAEHEQRYQARVAELENHEKQLQKQLDERKNEITWSEQSGKKSGEMEKQVAKLESEKQSVAAELDAMTRQNKLLQAALEDKANELKNIADSSPKKLAAVQSQLDGLDKSSGKQIAQLTAALQQKTAEYDALSRQMDIEKQKKEAKLPNDLAKTYKAQIATFEKQLSEVKTLREAEKSRADQVQAELETARSEIASLKQALPAEQQRVASLQSALDQKQSALDRQARVQAEEAKRLEDRRGELEKMRGDIAENQYQGTLETRGQVQELLSRPSVSSVSLSAVQSELTRKQADLERQAASQKSEAERLESERTRIEQMKASMDTSALVSSEKEELAAARQRIAELEKNYRQSTTRIAELETSLKSRLSGQTAENQKHLTDLDKREADFGRREQELSEKEAELGRKLAMLDKQPAKSAVVWQAEGDNPASAEALKKAQADLAAERQNLAAAQADVLRLQKIISGDQQKIASLQSELADKTAAVADVSGKADGRVAQLARDNAALQEQLRGKTVAEAEVTRLQGIIASNQDQIDLLNKAQQEMASRASSSAEMESVRVAELERKVQEQARQLAEKQAAVSPASMNDERIAQLEQKIREQSLQLSAKEAELSSVRIAALAPVSAPARAPAPAQETVMASVPTTTVEQASSGSGWKKILGFGGDKKDSGVWSYEPVKAPPQAAAVLEAPPVSPAITPVFETNTMDAPEVNKAAAFLEKIMAVHRSGGKSDQTSALEPEGFSPEPVGIEPAAGDAMSSDFDVLPPVAPVKTTATVAVAAPLAEVVASSTIKETFLSPVVKTSALTVDLRSVLASAGITPESFTQGDPATVGSGGFTYYQWTAGELNGLFEQSSWSAAQSFEGMVESYIDRYREDCPAQLAVSIGAYEKRGDQNLAEANVSCGLEGNSYVTAFVFQGGGGVFSAILHTGFPDARAKVLSTADSLADVLRDRDGQITASSGISSEQAVKKEIDFDSFETVYVQ